MLSESEGERARGPRVQLGSLLIIAATWGFVTLLLSTGSIAALVWPLMSVPIVLAGLLLGPGGGVVTGALSALAAFLLLREHTSSVWAGIGSFTAIAVIAGIKTTRDEARIVELQALSALDQETGVISERHFCSRVEEEARRSVRYRHSFGVVRASVSGYQSFVRKFGSFKGKAMLARFAEAVRAAVRDSDIVGRLGEHDIGILLPQSGTAECQAVATRVSDIVAQTRFEGDAVEPFVTAEARTAWAVFPDDAENVETLLGLLRERIALADDSLFSETGVQV
ncbi:GGDEF domain-containing protein [Coriobacteriia bacterium Es71-Z0120]|uniref:GGDEF domain-containing protein n=1 Tax=Parvivirga hydrogeniphila TaxID=2939460 RepID=UPI002260A7FC|nr:GGDEF domain-containing protein [Parvivirga hydrogeniphila]MCL4078648.1 GGDEF domain-containing protein [Parvivirga hydrogeniphila]